MNSKKNVTVEDLRRVNGDKDAAFRVVKVTNSLKFSVGQILSARELENQCISGSWTVNVIGKK